MVEESDMTFIKIRAVVCARLMCREVPQGRTLPGNTAQPVFAA
jgi:hypothetical protein